MAIVQKSIDKDLFDVNLSRTQEEDKPDYFNILKKYMKRIPKSTNRYECLNQKYLLLLF